jgi:hypothetical protein
MNRQGWEEREGRHGKLIAHVGGRQRTRDELKGLHTPDATDTWKPVPHYDLVSELIGGLKNQGITVGRDYYVTNGPADAQLLGYMDLEVPGMVRPDFGLGLGISTANDKSKAIRIVAAARVFVCDNQAFAGDGNAVFLRAKHTSGLRLDAVIPAAVESFLIKAEGFTGLIDKMKEYELADELAKALIHDAFAANRVSRVALFPHVSRLYFADEQQRAKFPDRTLWSLNNAFTEAAKLLQTPKKGPGLKLAAEDRIGRYFSRTVRRLTAPVQRDLPLGIEEADAHGIRREDVEPWPVAVAVAAEVVEMDRHPAPNDEDVFAWQ